MSGGLAYVYDPHGKLPALCNVDVASDLFPVEESKDLVTLKSLLQRHVKFTGSSLGKAILAKWEEAHKSFVKVGVAHRVCETSRACVSVAGVRTCLQRVRRTCA